MDESYAIGRRKNPAIMFRYRLRAAVAAQAAIRYLGAQTPLRVLDFGSADGATILEMTRLLPPASTFAGVERSPQLLRRAAAEAGSAGVVLGDIAALPDSIRRREFDLVTALAVLEHLERPVDGFSQAAGVLRSRGILVATFPEPFWDRLSTRLHMLEDHHAAHLTRHAALADARRAGFEILDYQRFMWAPVGVLPYLRILISPQQARRFDEMVRRFRLANWLFVNQILVARKP